MNAQRISVIKKFVALLTVMHIALCSFSQSTRGNQILSSDDFFGSFVNRSWTASDGLPANTITSIMQDRNDYMYMGTYSGLVRFDGIDFLTINSSLDSKYLRDTLEQHARKSTERSHRHTSQLDKRQMDKK